MPWKKEKTNCGVKSWEAKIRETYANVCSYVITDESLFHSKW